MVYSDDQLKALIIDSKFTFDSDESDPFGFGNLMSFGENPVEVKITTEDAIHKIIMTKNHWVPFSTKGTSKIQIIKHSGNDTLGVFLFSSEAVSKSSKNFTFDKELLIPTYQQTQRYPITTWMYELWNRLYFEIYMCQVPLVQVIDFCTTELIKEKYYLTAGFNSKAKHVLDSGKDVDMATQKAIQYILENLSEDITLDEVATNSGVSLSTLRRKFLKYFGVAPIHYLRKERMTKAYELLSTTNYSVGDVAFMVGYTDHSAFTMAFKNEFKIIPSQVSTQSGIKGTKQR